MALEPGTRFGPYEVAEQIGAGGMGEVWRATDTELNRDVAVKVLPQAFVDDADRLARFKREAEILASLNHPNIAQIYGLERSGDQTIIVMELVEGPTLADRIKEGPIPPDESMGIALQIVSALEAAHDKQIVHRDLKPANVKVKADGTVKVLDFGISKPIDPTAISGSPVMTTPAVTQTGVILGTAAYMSPEQARGKFVDQRTDIWAFGCLLFEMLTGQPAFGGEDVMLTLARVLANDTNLDSIPATISPAVRHTIRLCLEKDPRKRIHHIGDVRLALEGAFEAALPQGTQSGEPAAARRPLPIAAAVIAMGLLAGTTAWFLKPAPPEDSAIVTRFDHELPDGVGLRNSTNSVIDIAPNGEFLVYNGTDGIYIRPMGEVEARSIPVADSAVFDIVVSPDSREVAYFRNDTSPQLVKVAVNGGAPVVLVDPITNPYGLSWETDGTMLYGQPDGIWQVSENGGTAERVIAADGEETAYGPQLLPGGEWVLFTLTRAAGANRWNEADLVIESLATGERRVLRSGGHDARYLPTGHITYLFENVLFASAFDLETLTLDDARVSLVQGVRAAVPPLGGSGFYAASSDGTLVYMPGTGGTSQASPQKSLVWVDRQGNTERLPLRPDDYTMARVSPDGTKVALVIGAQLPATDPLPDLYIFDLETENLTQLTFDVAGDDGPVWSRDGSQIYFRSYREGSGTVYVIPAEGGTPQFVGRSPLGQNPHPWAISPDDSTLLMLDAITLQDVNLATLAIGESEEVTPLLDLSEQLAEPSLSPDGQWMVYYQYDNQSDPEINIRPFPDVRQQRRPVTPGMHPRFSPDGSEIFFYDRGGLSTVAVQYEPFRVGPAEQLFRGQYWYGVAGPGGELGRAWDVDLEGDRFLMITLPDAVPGEDGEQVRLQVNVELNWFQELEQRVPID